MTAHDYTSRRLGPDPIRLSLGLALAKATFELGGMRRRSAIRRTAATGIAVAAIAWLAGMTAARAEATSVASPTRAAFHAVEQDARPAGPKRFSYGTFDVNQPGTAPDAVNAPRHLLNGGIDTQGLPQVSGTVTLKQPAQRVWFRIVAKEQEIFGPVPVPVVTINGNRLINARHDPSMNGWFIDFGRSVKSFGFSLGRMADRGWRVAAHSLQPTMCWR